MKVFIVPSWYPTEINSISGIFFQEQALALKRSGMDVTILYPEIRSLKTICKYKIDIGSYCEIENGLKTYRYRGYNYLPRLKGHIRKKHLKWLERLFYKAVKDQGYPDIIHAHSVLWGGWAASEIAKKHSIPFMITEHSSAFTRDLLSKYHEKYIIETLDISDCIITVGPSLKEKISLYTEKEVMIIPNVVNTESFHIDNNIKNVGEFRFFSLAFLNPNKGMDVLLKAFSIAFSRNDKVKLVIGGDGKERNTLDKIVSDLKLEGKVSFLGRLTREETIVEMKKCNSFVLASRSETFGVVYIEALACGKPIIATKCGGPEMIVNENNGLLVEIDDPEGLAEAMLNMVDKCGEYDSVKIVEDCYNRFSEEEVSNQLTILYNRIIN